MVSLAPKKGGTYCGSQSKLMHLLPLPLSLHSPLSAHRLPGGDWEQVLSLVLSINASVQGRFRLAFTSWPGPQDRGLHPRSEPGAHKGAVRDPQSLTAEVLWSLPQETSAETPSNITVCREAAPSCCAVMLPQAHVAGRALA